MQAGAEPAAHVELGLRMPNASTQALGWARNDTLRIVGVLLPPCSSSLAPHDHPPNYCSAHDHADALAAAATPAGSAAQRAAQRMLRPVAGAWHAAQATLNGLVEILEMPDYLTYLNAPPRERRGAHVVSLAMALPLMLLLRITVPTLAEDFYDPWLLIVASLTAPFAAASLFQITAPWWLLLGIGAGVGLLAGFVTRQAVRHCGALAARVLCCALARRVVSEGSAVCVCSCSSCMQVLRMALCKVRLALFLVALHCPRQL